MAGELGLAVRGGFHPRSGEFPGVPGPPATLVLLGFTGAEQWRCFAACAEARDGSPEPLDRWSRRVIGTLAREFDARELYPSGPELPQVPFQRLALRCEPVHPSPLGLLIHERWGLWHAYRGALVLPAAIELPPQPASATAPCARCRDRPCLARCPVGAFREGMFDMQACIGHVSGADGQECRQRGCLARRACPVGAQFQYGGDQSRFHMRAFLRAARP